MCKFIGKSIEQILCKLNKSEILRLYSIVHVAMETTKTSNFTCQSKSFISIFFTWQVSACELQPFSCHDLANDIRSQTAKTMFSHLKGFRLRRHPTQDANHKWNRIPCLRLKGSETIPCSAAFTRMDQIRKCLPRSVGGGGGKNRKIGASLSSGRNNCNF